MYKLLLATNQADVKEAFSRIPDLNRLMFEPVTILGSAQEAIDHLTTHGADAIGFDLGKKETRMLTDHLTAHQPYLPIFRTYRRGADLRAELHLVREHLDKLHADVSDYENDPGTTAALLHNDLMLRLLENKISTREELESRLLLARSPLSVDYPGYLFEFRLPEGRSYLQTRWHHGIERLGLALRANFFGRLSCSMHYSASLLTPEHLRVIVCSPEPLSDKEVDVLSRNVQEQVLKTAEQVKLFMDLELICEQFRVLDKLASIIPETR
jgi:hypothetical protein